MVKARTILHASQSRIAIMRTSLAIHLFTVRQQACNTVFIHTSRSGVSVTAEGAGSCCDDAGALFDVDAVAMLLG